MGPDCARPYKPYEQMSLNFIPLSRRRWWRSLNRKATLWHFLFFRKKILGAGYMRDWREENRRQGYQWEMYAITLTRKIQDSRNQWEIK